MHVELSTGVTLHVREHGTSAPPYLLLHGWSVSGAIWDPVLARWPAGGNRVLVPDQRGTGFSSKPRDGYTLDDFTGDVVSLVDKLDLSDLILVGHSMGGTIAQRAALELQGRLRALVLVAPVPASGFPVDDEQQAFFRSLKDTREGCQQALVMTMDPDGKPDPALLDAAVRDTATVTREAFLGGFDAWRTASFADRLGDLKTPTVVMGGTKETVLQPDFLREKVVDPIPDARFVALDGVGHYPQIEGPDAFTDSLLAVARDA